MLYSPLAGGLLTAKYRKGETGRLTISEPDGSIENAVKKDILDPLESVLAAVNATPCQVALAWTLTKNAFPVVGARTLHHLTDSLKALDVDLNQEQLERLETVSSVKMGYPHELLQTVQMAC